MARSFVHRLITKGSQPGAAETLTLMEASGLNEIDSDAGASRRQMLRRLGAFGLAIASGGAIGSEVEAKNRRRGNRNKNRNGTSAGETAGGGGSPSEVSADGQATSKALTLISSPGPTSSAKQWKVNTANGGSLTPNVKFSMRNAKIGSYLKYGSRRWGINLVWTSTNTRTFSVRRSSGSTSPIKYGETVALKIDGGSYVKYASRDFGINLGWSSTPVYQWQIRGGATGAVVPNNATVQLYNNVAPRTRFPPWCGKPGSAVVYSWRPVGVNLVWNPPGFWVPTYSIPGLPNWAEDWLKKIAEAAAQAYGIPVAEYKSTYKTLCSVVRTTGETANERGEEYTEDAGHASLDAAALQSIADDKLASGDALTDEDQADTDEDPADLETENDRRKNRKRKHGNGKHRGGNGNGNGNGRGRNGHH